MDLNAIQQHAQTPMGGMPMMGNGPMMPMHPGMAPSAPQSPASLPVPQTQLPPPQILMQLATAAKTLDPLVLGAFIFHALSQNKEPLSIQGITDLSK